MNRIFVSLQLIFFSFCYSQDSVTERAASFNIEDHLALEGYDPVSYFEGEKPVKGSKQYSANYKGVVYRFCDEESKNKFLLNPTKYEPAYGGWCAYAMGAKAKKVSVDPETFKIIDGKLNLFYNSFFNNTLKSWNKDEQNLKEKAAENWLKF
jgi:YHS domain-containing protein